ncbi:MAG TPA: hypothetical protein PLY50_09750 [Burkholderiaceae bacterium]|nr:hypothetical protein [Burkholderiaceae bacterium]
MALPVVWQGFDPIAGKLLGGRQIAQALAQQLARMEKLYEFALAGPTWGQFQNPGSGRCSFIRTERLRHDRFEFVIALSQHRVAETKTRQQQSQQTDRIGQDCQELVHVPRSISSCGLPQGAQERRAAKLPSSPCPGRIHYDKALLGQSFLSRFRITLTRDAMLLQSADKH